MDYKRFHEVVRVLSGAALWGRTWEEVAHGHASMKTLLIPPTPVEIEEVMGMTLRQIQERMRAYQDALDAQTE